MQRTLAELPPQVLAHICSLLEVEDVCRLRQTCKSLKLACDSDVVWKTMSSLYCDRWGDVEFLTSLLREARLTEKQYQQSTTHGWRNEYICRERAEVDEAEAAVLEGICRRAEEKIHQFEENGNEQLLSSAVDDLLEILKVRNDIPEVYLHLAYACSLRDADEEALQFLDMADFLDPENENAQNLRTSIEAKLEAIEEKKKINIDQLVAGGELTEEFRAILEHLFKKFDRDQDGAWSKQVPGHAPHANSNAEFSQFVEATNGTPPPMKFVHKVFETFDTNKKGNLTLEGLLELYLHNTIDDPEETWHDLQAHGCVHFEQTAGKRVRRLAK